MADFCIREVRETTPPLLDAFAALMPQLSAGLEAPSAAALERIVRSPSAAMFAAWRDGAAVGALTLVWYDVPSGRKAGSRMSWSMPRPAGRAWERPSCAPLWNVPHVRASNA